MPIHQDIVPGVDQMEQHQTNEMLGYEFPSGPISASLTLPA